MLDLVLISARYHGTCLRSKAKRCIVLPIGGSPTMEMKFQKYVCTECGAEDTPAFFPSEPILSCFNCYKCGAGRSYPNVLEQYQRHIGMFPVLEDQTIAEESLSAA